MLACAPEAIPVLILIAAAFSAAEINSEVKNNGAESFK